MAFMNYLAFTSGLAISTELIFDILKNICKYFSEISVSFNMVPITFQRHLLLVFTGRLTVPDIHYLFLTLNTLCSFHLGSIG